MTDASEINPVDPLGTPKAELDQADYSNVQADPAVTTKDVIVQDDPLVTLETELDKIDYSKLQAESNNIGTSSGKTMYVDLGRTDFVINGKKIDRALVGALKEGAQRNKNNSDNTFDNFWKEHYNNPQTPGYQKTDPYKKEFEKFYNAGKKLSHLLPAIDDDKQNYISFAKEVFKEMFKYAGASIPNDTLLKELITNCNQGGYIGALYSKDQPYYHLIMKYKFMVNSDTTVHINCKAQDNVIVKLNEKVNITPIGIKEEICNFSSSLKFTLESKDGKNITCKDGKLSLAVPKRLKNYNVGNKNLFYTIKECFQKLCEKFGLYKKKIERSFSQTPDNQPSEKGHLNNVKSPTKLIMSPSKTDPAKNPIQARARSHTI